MPHHAVTQDDNLFEPRQNLTDFLGGEPPHVTSPGHVGSIEANASSSGHGIDEGFSVIAEGCEGRVEIERGDVACVAVLVGCECVDAVRVAVRECFCGLEGSVR